MISELAYFLASSRTRARPFWFTKSTMARRRSSFSTEVRLTGMIAAFAYDHIRSMANWGTRKAIAATNFTDPHGQDLGENQEQPRITRRGRIRSWRKDAKVTTEHTEATEKAESLEQEGPRIYTDRADQNEVNDQRNRGPG